MRAVLSPRKYVWNIIYSKENLLTEWTLTPHKLKIRNKENVEEEESIFLKIFKELHKIQY